MAISDNIKRGSVDMLLLTLLSEGDMYGYQMSQELENRSNGYYSLQESSMYPILYRLEDKGYISGVQKRVGKRRMRVYYKIEDSGREYLAGLRKDYFALVRGILKIMDITDWEELQDA